MLDGIKIRCSTRLVQGLSPGHLLHEKCAGHGGVGLGMDLHTVQVTQIGGTAQRVFEPLISLIDASRPLQ